MLLIFKLCLFFQYRGADKSLALPERKQTRKHVKDAHGFNNMEARAVIKFFPPLQSKAPKEIHAILTETLACFLPGRAKDLSALLQLYICSWINERMFIGAETQIWLSALLYTLHRTSPLS